MLGEEGGPEVAKVILVVHAADERCVKNGYTLLREARGEIICALAALAPVAPLVEATGG